MNATRRKQQQNDSMVTNMKKIQIAHLFRCGRFIGYGVAVDGELLNTNANTTIDTDANNGIPKITVSFSIDTEMANNPVNIELKRTLYSNGEGEAKSL